MAVVGNDCSTAKNYFKKLKSCEEFDFRAGDYMTWTLIQILFDNGEENTFHLLFRFQNRSHITNGQIFKSEVIIFYIFYLLFLGFNTWETSNWT